MFNVTRHVAFASTKPLKTQSRIIGRDCGYDKLNIHPTKNVKCLLPGKY